jgi:hypothetical protein
MEDKKKERQISYDLMRDIENPYRLRDRSCRGVAD